MLQYTTGFVVRLCTSPHVDSQINNFEKQGHSQRSESGLAAAVCLLDMCLRTLNKATLDSNINVS